MPAGGGPKRLRPRPRLATSSGVSLQRKLDSWVEAGLLDEDAAARINAFEQQDRRPLAIWAATALGLLAVVLGVMLLVSANWDRIPDWLKLAVHLLLLAGVGGLFWRAWARGQLWLAEALLFIGSGLVLAGIALQAQVYQLTGPVWASLLLWLALVAPALLLAGRTRLTGSLLAILAMVAPAAMAIATIDAGGWWLLAQGLALATPLVVLVLATFSRRRAFRAALVELGVGALLGGASIVHVAWAFDIGAAAATDSLLRLLPAMALAALCLWRLRVRPERLRPPLPTAIVLGSVVVVALALVVPHSDDVASRVVGALLFAAYWGGIARAAALTGADRLFAIAVGALAVRIFIVYLELFGSLAATGAGLLVGGLLLVALSWGWQRMVRRRGVA